MKKGLLEIKHLPISGQWSKELVVLLAVAVATAAAVVAMPVVGAVGPIIRLTPVRQSGIPWRVKFMPVSQEYPLLSLVLGWLPHTKIIIMRILVFSQRSSSLLLVANLVMLV